MAQITRRLLHRLAHTPVGERAITSILRADPLLARNAIGPLLNRPPRFSNVPLPDRLDGGLSLAFLFSPNTFNYGIAHVTLDEAAYLYDLAHGLGPATLVEIGRYKGGGTFLLAAAMHPEAELWSYDLRVKQAGAVDHVELDSELVAALERYGLAERTHLIIGDSRTADPPPGPCDLVFVDGDHSYAGVRADFERWHPRLAPGGHLVFHDARDIPFHTYEQGVGRLVSEIDGTDFVRMDARGSLVHFQARLAANSGRSADV